MRCLSAHKLADWRTKVWHAQSGEPMPPVAMKAALYLLVLGPVQPGVNQFQRQRLLGVLGQCKAAQASQISQQMRITNLFRGMCVSWGFAGSRQTHDVPTVHALFPCHWAILALTKLHTALFKRETVNQQGGPMRPNRSATKH